MRFQKTKQGFVYAFFLLLAFIDTATANRSELEFEVPWLTEDRRSLVEIRPCGRFFCGYLLAFEGDAPPLVLEKRPLCDMRLLGGLRKERQMMTGGWLYDLEAQLTFNLILKREGEKLKLRVYQDDAESGEILTWTRPNKATPKCTDQ